MPLVTKLNENDISLMSKKFLNCSDRKFDHKTKKVNRLQQKINNIPNKNWENYQSYEVAQTSI